MIRKPALKDPRFFTLLALLLAGGAIAAAFAARGRDIPPPLWSASPARDDPNATRLQSGNAGIPLRLCGAQGQPEAPAEVVAAIERELAIAGDRFSGGVIVRVFHELPLPFYYQGRLELSGFPAAIVNGTDQTLEAMSDAGVIRVSTETRIGEDEWRTISSPAFMCCFGCPPLKLEPGGYWIVTIPLYAGKRVAEIRVGVDFDNYPPVYSESYLERFDLGPAAPTVANPRIVPGS